LNSLPKVAMTSKFTTVPSDGETKLLLQCETRVGDLDALWQWWVWDGITAESLIFASADVAGLSNADLEKAIKDSSFYKGISSITISRTDSGYTFVNFNFVEAE